MAKYAFIQKGIFNLAAIQPFQEKEFCFRKEYLIFQPSWLSIAEEYSVLAKYTFLRKGIVNLSDKSRQIQERKIQPLGNRRNTCNSMSARNSMVKGKSMAASNSMEISKARTLSTAERPTIEGRPTNEISNI